MGGNWAQYHAMIKGFAAAVRAKARVVIVKLPEGPGTAAASSGGRGDGKRQGTMTKAALKASSDASGRSPSGTPRQI